MTGPVHYSDGTFPPDGQIKWENLIPHIGRTAAAVARYDGFLGAIPNPDILLALMATQEAVHSSWIEGIQATMGEVLELEAGNKPGSNVRKGDVHEVLNCRAAMRVAEKMLVTLPLSQRVVRTAHATLMSGARGRSKSPGEFRKIPNWIGSPGCAIDEAKFVPVAAHSLPDAIQRWENFVHSDAPDQLVQLAIVHAEFEAIHPFLDGNGRLGRMLIPLFMWQKGLIRRPMFYISAFLESHRDAYYERLLSVSRDDDWTGWSQFFLEAVRVQAEDNLEKAQTIFNLYEGLKQRVADMTRSHYAIPRSRLHFPRTRFLIAQYLFQRLDSPQVRHAEFWTCCVKKGFSKRLLQAKGTGLPFCCFQTWSKL